MSLSSDVCEETKLWHYDQINKYVVWRENKKSRKNFCDEISQKTQNEHVPAAIKCINKFCIFNSKCPMASSEPCGSYYENTQFCIRNTPNINNTLGNNVTFLHRNKDVKRQLQVERTITILALAYPFVPLGMQLTCKKRKTHLSNVPLKLS
jgi:hypothetical protein